MRGNGVGSIDVNTFLADRNTRSTPTAIPGRKDNQSSGVSAEFKAKAAAGPVVHMSVLTPCDMSMTGPLVLWFVYSILVSVFAGYLAGPNEREVATLAGVRVFVEDGIAMSFEGREVVVDASAGDVQPDSFSCEAELGFRFSLDRLPAL